MMTSAHRAAIMTGPVCAYVVLLVGCDSNEGTPTSASGCNAEPVRIVACARPLLDPPASYDYASMLAEGISGTVEQTARGIWSCDGIGGEFFSKYGETFRFRVKDGRRAHGSAGSCPGTNRR
jgi:hypothetical protein